MALSKHVRRYFQRMGKAGGLKGGPARNKALTPEERSQIARMGGLARAAKIKA